MQRRAQKRAPLPPEPSRARPCHLSRPSTAKVRTLPRKTADVQKRAPLPAEPSRARPCHCFPPSRPKVRTLPRKTADVQKRAPLPPEPSKVRPCHGFAPLKSKSDNTSTQNRGRPKARARYRQSPLEHAPATFSQASRPKVWTFPRQTADVQKRAPLPPEPSRARPCRCFAALKSKSEDPSTQNRGRPKARAATGRAL